MIQRYLNRQIQKQIRKWDEERRAICEGDQACLLADFPSEEDASKPLSAEGSLSLATNRRSAS